MEKKYSSGGKNKKERTKWMIGNFHIQHTKWDIGICTFSICGRDKESSKSAFG